MSGFWVAIRVSVMLIGGAAGLGFGIGTGHVLAGIGGAALIAFAVILLRHELHKRDKQEVIDD